MTEKLHFRPHARLLTMLGEQLIKNDQIALVELVKNSYDADASWVQVDFRDFGPSFEKTSSSRIIITDDGSGMGEAILREAWMSPATPEKLRRKRKNPTTQGGRILQGEKGIGRFAVFKLGAAVVLTTRQEGDTNESVLEIDLGPVEAATESNSITVDEASGKLSEAPVEIYLDEISAELTRTSAQVFTGSDFAGHGTRLEIKQVRSDWTLKKAQKAFSDLERIQPIMWNEAAKPEANDFKIEFLKDGESLGFEEKREVEIGSILQRAVLAVTSGHVDLESREIYFSLNGRDLTLDIDSPEIRALRPLRDRFGTVEDNPLPVFTCGSFGFEFYVFDLSSTAPSSHQLDRSEKAALREHRIYLYRDDVRVYPYGDPDDDWLQIDVIRGTQSARSMFSNDQTVGYVSISQELNPNLQDKTNREGLLEQGEATQDFVALIQTVLAYLRSKPYEQYASANRRSREHSKPIREQVDAEFTELKAGALSLPAQQAVDRLEAAISRERDIAELQIARTQQLAGVGLSVETASHDLIASGSESLRLARLIIAELERMEHTQEHVFSLATSLVQRLEFIDSRFQDVQGLFVSTRQRRGALDVSKIVDRVAAMYSSIHSVKEIEFEIDLSHQIRAKSTESAILQALINLVDNATFWLLNSPRPRIIRAWTPSPTTLAISDSGPGVDLSDEPFIFEPFYSGKGEEGKGLGLYIARESGLRNGFTVNLEESKEESLLPGATFTLTFESVEEND